MAIDAVLFEFDGVLAETSAARRGALQRSLAEDGIRLSDVEYADFCATLPVRDAVRAALALRGASDDETSIDLATLRAERRFAEYLGKGVSLAEGAADLIAELAGRVRLGIVARAGRRQVDMVIALSGLEHVFECVVAAEDAYPPKPSPAPYQSALARLGRRRPLRTSAVLALEDGAAGIRSARAAGLRCLAVGHLPVHQAMDADAYVASLAGLSLSELERLLSSNGELIR